MSEEPADKEYPLAVSEHLEDMFEVHQRDYAYQTQPYTGPDSEPTTDHRPINIVRAGQPYHADTQTLALLVAAQTYDEGQTQPGAFGERRMQDIVFDHAVETGRIQAGPHHDEGHDQTHRHGHRP